MSSNKAKIGIINISDRASQGIYEDIPGKAAKELLEKYLTSEWDCCYNVVPDEFDDIKNCICDFADNENCCLIN